VPSRKADRGRLDMVAVSELAEYAYCPRAWYYRDHPLPEGPDPRAIRSRRAGVRFHERSLRGVRRRAEYGAIWFLALTAGLLGLVGLAAGWYFGWW
jgi:CRISPR/Cas system-associated exonuclease Cas4 (RecB family)